MVVNHRTVLAAVVTGFVVAACGGGEDPSAARERPVVVATNWPLCSFASRLGGERVEVGCVLLPGEDARGWRPQREELRALTDADLLLLNGAGLEEWAARANLPRGRVVDTAAGFVERHLEIPGAVVHSHGTGEVHTHAGTDPHTWLDPELAILQARAVRDGLARVLPADAAAELDARLAELVAELRENAALLDALPPLRDGEVVAVTHPTWAYVAARKDWPIVELEVDPTRPPTAPELDVMRARLAGRHAVVILWEAAPADAVVERLRAAFDAPSVVWPPDVSRTGPERASRHVVGQRRAIESLRAALQRG